MEWDSMLEKLRREAFRPSIPPPVRLPRWAVATLVGAGLTLSGAACDRGDSPGSPAADRGTPGADAGVAKPPEKPLTPPEATAMPPETQVTPPVTPVSPPETDLKPIDTPPPPPEERKVTPVTLPMVVPDYGIPAMRRPMEPAVPREAPMYGGPGLDRPTVSASGLVPGDAPQDVRRALQAFPYMISSCFQQAHTKGLVGKTGDLRVTVSLAAGRLTVTGLGGSLAGAATFADCVKARIGGRTMGSSDEARAYSKNWTFGVQIIAADAD